VDAKNAEILGVGCYIAAEIVVVQHQQPFVVGDGKTYGGYYNAPLKPENSYRIWFGLIVTVDGVSNSVQSLFYKRIVCCLLEFVQEQWLTCEICQEMLGN
jgi:hypothetical protein